MEETPSTVQVLGSGCSRVVGVEGCVCSNGPKWGHWKMAHARLRESVVSQVASRVLQPEETTKCASL